MKKLQLLVLLAILMPVRTMADHIEDTYLYMVNMVGVDQLDFEMPVFDVEGYDGWVDDGYVYVTPEGGSKQTLLKYRSYEGDADDYGEATVSKGVDGLLILHRKRGYSDVVVTTSSTKYKIPFESGLDYGKLYLSWKVPENMRGKKLTVSWKVHKTGNMTEWATDVDIEPSEVTFPAAPELVKPTVMEPMMSYDAMHGGQMMIVYSMPSSNIKSLSAEYKEVNGIEETTKVMPLEAEMSGMFYLDVNKCYKDFTIKAKYTDTEDKVRNSASDPIPLPTMQLPVGLSASLQSDGSVLLSWRKSHPKWPDIQDGDLWDIQRNTTGSLNADGEWVSISQTSVTSDSIFNYVDNTLLAAYQGKPVYYRVRRASTTAWNWPTGYYAQVSLPSIMKLQAVDAANVKRGTWNDNRHMANFTFSFGSPQYDNQGRFILRTAQDWETLANLINTGEKTEMNVIMAADIDLGESQTKLGVNGHPYCGTFEGNGHVLTIHYNEKNDYAAPFAYIGNKATTISNLQVTGTIFTTTKYAGGFVGETMKNLTLTNCRSSVAITCIIDGDASAGGFVGRIRAGETTMTDCLFDGEFHDETAKGFGGLIGWSETTPTITNCLVDPSNLDIIPTFSQCQTFARVRYGAIINNSYFTTSLNGTETMKIGNDTYLVLRNNQDWETFLQKIVEAKGAASNVYAIMMSDFEITEPAGYRNEAPFRGIFDGNGHTLTVNIDGGSEQYMAPFYHVSGATIQNLNVRGTVKGDKHASGLIGSAEWRNGVHYCHVSTDVYTTGNYAGGIIGHAHTEQQKVSDCIFDGTITAETFADKTYAGSIIGWGEKTHNYLVDDCYENGTYTGFNHAGFNYHSKNGDATGQPVGGNNCWSAHVWDECNTAAGLTPDELVEKLGSNDWMTLLNSVAPKQTKVNVDAEGDARGMTLTQLAAKLGAKWQVSGNTVVPIATVTTDDQYVPTVWDKNAKLVLNVDKLVGGEVRYTERRELSEQERASGKLDFELVTSCVDHDFRFVVEKGTSMLEPVDTVGIVVTKTETGEEARYEFNNNVQLSDLQALTQQSSVVLSWKSTGNGDFYRISRRDKATDEEVVLNESTSQATYIDKSPRPQHVYIYTVEGVNNCEGEHISTVTQEGFCEPTGMVRGYVRMTDGTAMAGIKVIAEPQTGTAGQKDSTTTDGTGYYEIKGLQYNGSGSYHIMAESTGDMGAFTDYWVNFDDYTNMVTNANLVQNAYVLFSGYVMYDGTSVPVIGAQFERDGEIVHNGSGKPIITDSQGRFTISVPQGAHTVRAVKDGHVFLFDGYFTDPDAVDTLRHNWQKSIAGHVFWDQTKVMLQGRVVGGETQGNKPLGELASKNNLGDSITIVMQLEGDNASWLVRDQLNASITERHTDYYFGTNQLDTCHADVYRHRLVVKPSPVTGEYCIPMLPVKYKVTEIYAEGYPTLFQAGKVGETVDLSAYMQGDTATYSRIYHNTPTLAVEQFNMMGETYMGIKQYTELDNTGKEALVELWNDSTGYSFGYPVFMAGSPIILMLTAEERYYYNNDDQIGVPDIVNLTGGEVLINNALVGTDNSKTIALDSVGEGIYRFTPENLTFTEEDDMALKTLTMTLLYDGTYYDVLPVNGEPIRGYVMAAKAKSQGNRVITDGGTFLIDILRDPPGAGSSAYIESGTKLNFTFSQNVKAQLGFKMSIKQSSGGTNGYDGLWSGYGGGTAYGNITQVSNKEVFSLPIVATYYNSWQFGYTFETTERISTSSGNLNVGRDADVFIGMSQYAILEDAIAVRAINEDTYNLLTTHEGGTFNVEGVDFNVRQGTMKKIAEGVNSEGKKVYLVRDEVMSISSQLKSTFVHSQTYIEKELIPELVNVRNTLLLPMGTDTQTAQQMADNAGHAFYISKVPNDDDTFGVSGNYTQVNPTGKDGCSDSINIINNNIRTWVQFLAVNEREKLEANDLVKTYEVDGRTSVTYTESFATSDTESRYLQSPFQGTSGIDWSSISSFKNDPTKITKMVEEQDSTEHYIEIKMFGKELYIDWKIIASLDYNYNYGGSEGYTKKAGFTLAPSTKSNLLVDVYRTKMSEKNLNAKIEEMKEAGYTEEQLKEMFFQIPTDQVVKWAKGGGTNGNSSWLSYAQDFTPQYRSFVYRTRGGATNQPYEDERRTKYYNAGQLLDAKTVEIDRPRIWAEQASVSNVPYDEPARFTIYMANESEMPAMCTELFTYMISDADNPNGAKITVDGNTLPGEGHTIKIPSGQVVTKQVEICPSADYDYDNVVIQLYDPNDKKRVYSCKLSAHFVPVAGKVNISLPGDKWVVNTESQYDNEKQQYYMPVRIDGFDVNYRNFDHIELQYKLSTQGDNDWVNVCSYYKSDSLMAKATGVCKLIEDDGKIMATFWGESDPIEQRYDLRAVNYCRYGNGFLTRSSNILSGVKDTRRPQLFGTPQPEDGILSIGEDIMLRFSEPIAGNYLRDLNNFQVLGQTNTTNISLGTNLHFGVGDLAESMSARNLSAKSFTVDVMLNPDSKDKDMIFFSHGEKNGDKLELGITKEQNLSATFTTPNADADNRVVKFVSTEPVDFTSLHQVQYVFKSNIEAETTTVGFYDGSKEIGTFTLPRLYLGSGAYYLGTRRNGQLMNHNAYVGEMLEFRLWNRALSQGEMDEYRMKRLTGNELGLMDNFPLNEGTGEYSYNRTSNGGDLHIVRGTWQVPDGIGMKLDGEKGFRIDPQKFERADYHDYTLMFWFRTNDSEGTLLSNGLAQTEAGAKDHFNFGVKNGMFQLKLGGTNQFTNVKVNDGQWHHAALSVSRSRNVGSLYIDASLKKTFPVDTLGGLHGNYLAAGATYLDATTTTNAIKGNIDEIGMYEMALSENIIKASAPTTPNGEEVGLLAYLSFGRNELQIDNSQRLMPTGISLKRYYDATTGEFTTQRDTLIEQSVVDALADKTNYAPMRAIASLENIKYSYVAKDNEMYINLDVPAYAIEKTNVIVTVKDVADLNGNVMASPVTMDIYVYRNPLRWNMKQFSQVIDYGEAYSFEAIVQNLSGKSKRFSLDGLPIWITASQNSGTVGPLGELPITFTVSPYINIGDFDEIIYILGEDGMNEPLPINLKVRGEKPDWAVDEGLISTNISMRIVGQVTIDENDVANDSEDMLAAFDANHRLMGVTHLHNEASGNEGLAYLTVYNSNYAATPLYFEFFDASTGLIHQMTPMPKGATITFKNDTIMGTTTNPVTFTNTNSIIQAVPLKKGWNWVSFNIQPENAPVKQVLNNATKWQVGDGLEADKADGSHYLISYKAIANPKDPKSVNYVWDYADSTLNLDPHLMYRFYSTNDKLAYIAGSIFNDPITVNKGWNRIGYSSLLNLPLGTALANYTDQASEGDIIKSQSEFAILTQDATGNKTWKGTLEFMRAGEGYMLKRNADSKATFSYPLYSSDNRYNMAALAKEAPAFQNVSGTSMTVVAMADGVEVQPGDRLTAYRGAEVCGIAEADELGVFYLNVGGSEDAQISMINSQLTFMIERDDEMVALTSKPQMVYQPNAALGTPNAPTIISFTTADDFEADGWYLLNGIKLDKRPNKAGVYIYNGKKKVIK